MMMRRTYQQIRSVETPAILQQGATIVDVRRPEEWQLTGTIAGSVLLTFFDENGHSDPEKWLKKLDQQVAADVPLLLI